MCHTQNHPMKTTEPTSKPKPARKTRTKTRKPKFLSLSLSLSQCLEQQLSPETTQMTNPQLTLFPLHPENLFEEKESHDNNVAYLLEQEGGGGATLNGLLGGTDTSEDSESLSPSLLTYAYGGQDKDSEGASTLAQAALRHKKERDLSEEKWVLYSDVVEENKEEEISSSNGAMEKCYSYHTQQEFGLSLKLDYQEILNAWSDKGSLYIEEDKEEECPQTVPDQPQDDTSTNGFTDVGFMGNARLWNVPEDGSSITKDGREGKMGRREARVLRYKEKRQSRLFAKRIRYQVRKLNAEKRPRMKGRFVKRKAEV